MGTKVIINSKSPNRVSINNQQRTSVRTVGISGGSTADSSEALQTAQQAFNKANSAVMKSGDTMTGTLIFSTSNTAIIFSDGSSQNTAFSGTLDGGLF